MESPGIFIALCAVGAEGLQDTRGMCQTGANRVDGTCRQQEAAAHTFTESLIDLCEFQCSIVFLLNSVLLLCISVVSLSLSPSVLCALRMRESLIESVPGMILQQRTSRPVGYLLQFHWHCCLFILCSHFVICPIVLSFGHSSWISILCHISAVLLFYTHSSVHLLSTQVYLSQSKSARPSNST